MRITVQIQVQQRYTPGIGLETKNPKDWSFAELTSDFRLLELRPEFFAKWCDQITKKNGHRFSLSLKVYGIDRLEEHVIVARLGDSLLYVG